MKLEDAKKKLELMDQLHLLDSWNMLASDEKDHLLYQIEKLNVDTFFKQQELISLAPHSKHQSIKPFTKFHAAGNAADQKLGKEALAEGKMGCVIVAGGQGTRLKLNGPKGMFAITPIKKKSLFQLFAEKTIAAGKQVGQKLKLAIMTSLENDEMTKTYFTAHKLFNLTRQQLDFFSQAGLPLLNDKKQLFLDKMDTIATGPDGNGSMLFHFWQQGIGPKWKEEGIEFVNFVLIDNPLADPFDAELLGFHIRNGNQITVKCVERQDPEEKVGVLVEEKEKVRVIEYSELPSEEKWATIENGSLKHICANISLFCISLSFLEELVVNKVDLPLHIAKKTSPSGESFYKAEYFIFDIFPFADKIGALLYPRKDTFAPLKNYTGLDSPTTVRQAYFAKDCEIYEEMFGEKPPERVFELAQEFYYPLPYYLERLKDKPFPTDGYIEV